MDFKTKFNKAFAPHQTDRKSYIELVGSTDGILDQYKQNYAARKDVMRFAVYDVPEVASTAPSPAQVLETTEWSPYGDARYPFSLGLFIRVALPHHAFQDAFGLIVGQHLVDRRWKVKVTKRGNVVIMLLNSEEMLPNVGIVASKIKEKLYEQV